MKIYLNRLVHWYLNSFRSQYYGPFTQFAVLEFMVFDYIKDVNGYSHLDIGIVRYNSYRFSSIPFLVENAFKQE